MTTLTREPVIRYSDGQQIGDWLNHQAAYTDTASNIEGIKAPAGPTGASSLEYREATVSIEGGMFMSNSFKFENSIEVKRRIRAVQGLYSALHGAVPILRRVFPDGKYIIRPHNDPDYKGAIEVLALSSLSPETAAQVIGELDLYVESQPAPIPDYLFFMGGPL